LGNLEEGSSTRDFERLVKGAVGMELLSLKRLHGGGPWGGSFFTGDPGRYVKIGSGYGHLSPWGSLSSWGNLESGKGFVYRGL
jgi:hypothetical protein